MMHEQTTKGLPFDIVGPVLTCALLDDDGFVRAEALDLLYLSKDLYAHLRPLVYQNIRCANGGPALHRLTRTLIDAPELAARVDKLVLYKRDRWSHDIWTSHLTTRDVDDITSILSRVRPIFLSVELDECSHTIYAGIKADRLRELGVWIYSPFITRQNYLEWAHLISRVGGQLITLALGKHCDPDQGDPSAGSDYNQFEAILGTACLPQLRTLVLQLDHNALIAAILRTTGTSLCRIHADNVSQFAQILRWMRMRELSHAGNGINTYQPLASVRTFSGGLPSFDWDMFSPLARGLPNLVELRIGAYRGCYPSLRRLTEVLADKDWLPSLRRVFRTDLQSTAKENLASFENACSARDTTVEYVRRIHEGGLRGEEHRWEWVL